MMEGGGGLSLRYTGGVPTYLYHAALGDLEGHLRALGAALLEMAPAQVLFGSDYPQEIREPSRLAAYVQDVRSLPLPASDTQAILGGNAAALLGL